MQGCRGENETFGTPPPESTHDPWDPPVANCTARTVKIFRVFPGYFGRAIGMKVAFCS